MYFVFVILNNILYFKLHGVCEGPVLTNLFFKSDILQIILVIILYIWRMGPGYIK